MNCLVHMQEVNPCKKALQVKTTWKTLKQLTKYLAYDKIPWNNSKYKNTLLNIY